MLDELDTYSAWRKILGKPDPDPQRKDTELIVRFFAMRDRSSYKKPLKTYLLNFMKCNCNITNEVVNDYRETFCQTCTEIVANLGEKPFHLRSGVNPPALNAVMVEFSHHLKSIPRNISERYENLKKNSDFDKTTRHRTTEKSTTDQRFQKVRAPLNK